MYWEELEGLLERQTRDPDKLSQLFVKVSSDLSYARTFYPNRSVRLYLNNLTQRVFDSMRTDENKFKFEQITNFFKHILPQEIYNSRKALLTSLFVFVVAVGIGVISSKYNPDFPRIILGDSYVDMTEANIAKGDPMAVYKDERKLDMFFGITTNNIRVSLLAFVLGIIGSVGTIVVLLSNGIMLGSFQYFFVTKGLFWTSFLTIWIHGTIEISAIIIAGGAGIVLGNGLLFPKTYDRGAALQVAALRALRIILGAAPLFVIAGLLESFVTRQTELPTVVKAFIIGLSAVLILIMWVIYPWYYHKQNLGEDLEYNIMPQHRSSKVIKKYQYKDFSTVISDSVHEVRSSLTKIIGHTLLPTLLTLAVATYFVLKTSSYDSEDLNAIISNSLAKVNIGSVGLSLVYLALINYAFCMLAFLSNTTTLSLQNKLKFLKKYYLKILVITSIMFIPFTMINSYAWLVFWLLFSPHFYVITIEKIVSDEASLWANFTSAFKSSLNNWFKFFPYYLVGIFIYWVVMLFQSTLIVGFIADFVSWHNLFEVAAKNTSFVSSIINWVLFIVFTPVGYYFFRNQYYSTVTQAEAIDLNEKLKNFGTSNTVFEQL